MSINSMDINHQVKTNLELQNLWEGVVVHETILSGYPPRKLDSNDNEHQIEWVVPQMIQSQDNLEISEINSWFDRINKLSGERPKRITIALVSDDSTIVYYFIHDGVVKPRQN